MKRLRWLLPLLLIGALILAACGGAPEPEPKLTIVVTGSKGLQFKGEWEGTAGGGGRVDVVPQTPPRRLIFDVGGTITSMRFQKQQEEGMLRVEIREEIGDETRVIVRLETSDPFGVLTLGPQ